MAARTHQFYAVAFEENFSLRQIAPAFPDARVSALELYSPIGSDGTMFVFPFGAVVMLDAPPDSRDAQLAKLRTALPKLTTQVLREDYSVIEDPDGRIGIFNGMLHVDQLTRQRAGIVALTVAQSAAMEYYERLTDVMFARAGQFIERLEKRGTVPLRIRRMHRFIGEAIVTRTEVVAVLHLLDKPEATWEDPAMDRIYNDLRDEFDLADRYRALEAKMNSIQQSLELLLDVARDRRLVWLEIIVVLLILLEVVLSVVHFTI
ncbi:MAG TPA: RMD1 family protein [Candidatus Binataceae bacterium]|nr:RMD1 family protein [Candidatus Binataceae bacterium]